jgi:hypothetical protein
VTNRHPPALLERLSVQQQLGYLKQWGARIKKFYPKAQVYKGVRPMVTIYGQPTVKEVQSKLVKAFHWRKVPGALYPLKPELLAMEPGPIRPETPVASVEGNFEATFIYFGQAQDYGVRTEGRVFEEVDRNRLCEVAGL